MAFALAAGMQGLGVSWGFRDEAELWACGARQVFETAGALETFLLENL
jgi:phosphoglycolate phosphatase-like HAD superfamily hydrolase